MEIKVIKTRKFLPPKDDLFGLIKESITTLSENSVVAITSKVVSIGEGRCIPISEVSDKEELIKSEAQLYLPKRFSLFGRIHTITNGVLVGSSGIDESNANGHYVLWPKYPDSSARKIWEFIKREYKIKNLGIVITDSMAVPLKRGIVGIAISYCGFVPLKDNRGKKDIFGRVLKFSQTNIADSIASFAVYLMGEAAEQTPIVIFENLPFVKFSSQATKPKRPFSSFKVSINEDLFSSFLKSVPWEKGSKRS